MSCLNLGLYKNKFDKVYLVPTTSSKEQQLINKGN